MLDNFLFGDKYPIYQVEEKNNKVILYIKSKNHESECPHCHKVSKHYHSTYSRKIQDIPLHNTETWLYVDTYKYYCLNPKCKCKIFVETLPFAKFSQVKTDALISMILGISIFLSNSTSSLILSLIGVKVSADTIKNLYDKIEIIDDPNVEEIGIDDVATRKGQKYATAIYNLKDHSLIALLEGRDAKTLKPWLKQHKKIKLVTRDRATSYASAINEILPECTQIADRFHLFQNLINKLTDIFYAQMPEEIFIKNGEILDKKPKKVKDLFVKEEKLNKLNYNNSLPLDEFGNVIIFDDTVTDRNRASYKAARIRAENKQKFIKSVRDRGEQITNKKYQTLSKEFDISYVSARKYVLMTDEEVDKIILPKKGKTRKKEIANYINIIYKMIRDDYDFKTIYAYVIYKGYTGSLYSLEHHIYRISKNNFSHKQIAAPNTVPFVYPPDITVIKRKKILKFILTINPKKSKDKIINENIEIIKEKYQFINEIEQLFYDFHSAIMNDDPDLIEQFIDIYENSEINDFCNSIKKDIAAVKNAISYNISSGFVEGNNNKFKLIKRIVYGKSKLVNLFRKCYVAFLATTDNFTLDDLV